VKLKNSHPGLKGRTLIERIEIQMDKRRKAMEKLILEKGLAASGFDYVIQKGRYEGFAASLAILRSSSVEHEISRSNERLGITDE